METYSRQELLEAVNTLIASPRAHELFEALAALSPLAQRGVPAALTGDAAAVNPLLALRARDTPAYERVMAMVDARRAELGYDPLVVTKDKGYDKVAYMREFMDQKRERQRIAAVIENLRRPERDKLVGNARLDFMRRQSAVWKKLRDEALAQARAANGGSLSEAVRKATLEQFWSAVDADLEAKHAAAVKAAMDPHRRPPDTDMSELLAALNLPPR